MVTPDRVKESRIVVFSKNYKRYAANQEYFMSADLADIFKKNGAPIKKIDRIDYEKEVAKAKKRQEDLDKQRGTLD